MAKGFFVTGTDTNVGKTTVSCALLRAFSVEGYRAVGMKPIAAGYENGQWQDVELLLAASNVNVTQKQINPYAFEAPISPHLAAQQENVTIDLSLINDYYRRLSMQADIVIVEGAGGFLVPLNDFQTGEDLAKILNLPVILVVGMRLGCLNHALLTARAISAAQLNFVGWIANCIQSPMVAMTENITTLEQRLQVPLLGILRFGEQTNGFTAVPKILLC